MNKVFKTFCYYICGYLPIYLSYWLDGQDVKWWQAIFIMIGGLIFGLSWPLIEDKY